MGKYFKSGFYPQNFILLGSPEYQREKAEQIVKEAKKLFPEQFCGKRDSFPFELRYTPPFDKAFAELKRLQGTAAEEAGFRDEYRGYIVIDLSAYIKHEAEDYFELSIKFLYDMSDCWKYIFLIDNSSERAALELVSKVLHILDDVFYRVIELKPDDIPAKSRLVNEMCKKCGVICSESVRVFFKELLEHREYSSQLVFTIIRELAVKFGAGKIVNMQTVNAYFNNTTPVVRYMLEPKLYDKLIDVMKEKVEVEYVKAI